MEDNKATKIIVGEEEDETTFLMANAKNKAILLASIEQDKNGESIKW